MKIRANDFKFFPIKWVDLFSSIWSNHWSTCNRLSRVADDDEEEEPIFENAGMPLLSSLIVVVCLSISKLFVSILIDSFGFNLKFKFLFKFVLLLDGMFADVVWKFDWFKEVFEF